MFDLAGLSPNLAPVIFIGSDRVVLFIGAQLHTRPLLGEKMSIRIVQLAIAISAVLAIAAPAVAQSPGDPRKPDGTIRKPGVPAGTDTNGICYYSYVWTNVTTKGSVSGKHGYIRRDFVDKVCPMDTIGPGMVE